jgi:hypothetical protein
MRLWGLVCPLVVWRGVALAARAVLAPRAGHRRTDDESAA